MGIKKSWSVGVYAVTASLVTWPLLRYFNSTIPLGSETTPTVPLFNLWTISWNVDRLLHGYQGYWNAPIFYPTSGTFAFSDPQPLTGLLAAIFWPLGAAAAYNLVLLLFLTLNGWAAFMLLRRRGMAVETALLGGLLMQMLPFLAHERGVLQLQPIFGLLWAVEGLWQLATRPTRRWAIKLGSGLAITFLTSAYYALFLLIMLVVALPFLPPTWRERRFWRAIWPGVLIAILCIAPVALPQLKAIQRMGFSRSVSTITENSATLTEYGRLSLTLRSAAWFPWHFAGDQSLFPGFGLLLLALLALFTSWRHAWTLYLAAGAVTAWLLSFGFHLQLGGWKPYALLHDFAPGFDNLRSPFRWGYFVQVYLALLAIIVIDRWWKNGRRWWSLGLMALLLVELMPTPARLTTVPPPLNIEELTPPLIFLPFAENRTTAAFGNTTRWMAATRAHSIPMVNGYSGYFPQLQGQLRSLLATFPSPGSIAVLRDLGVKTIVVATESLTPDAQNRLSQQTTAGSLLPLTSLATLQVYELTNAHFNPADHFDGRWALSTLLDGEELILWAYAAVPDAQVYVADPVLSPLKWRVTWWSENGPLTTQLVSPPGTVLLYHGSDRRLRVTIPRPQISGITTIILQNAETGQLLGKTTVTIP